MHVGFSGVEGLSVHQEYHARGVQLEPHLLDDAIKIELQSGGNLLRQDRITLLGAGGLGPLADAQNLHCHVSEVEGLSSVRDVALDLAQLYRRNHQLWGHFRHSLEPTGRVSPGVSAEDGEDFGCPNRPTVLRVTVEFTSGLPPACACPSRRTAATAGRHALSDTKVSSRVIVRILSILSMEFPRLDTQSFSIDDPVETVVSGMITALSR